MQVIKWFDLPNWEQMVQLDGNNYYIECLYNIRDESWYFSIRTNDNISLVTGKKLTFNTNLLATTYSPLKPKGVLTVVSMNPDIKEVTRDNMGKEVKLIYISNDEIL